MTVDILQLGFLKTNCYIISNEDNRECVVIDPGAEGKRIISFLEEKGLKLTGILLTHCHCDHVLAMWPLYEYCHVPVYLSEKDTAPIVNIGPFRFVAVPDSHYVVNGESIMLAGLTFRTIECPGHTPGSLSFLCNDCLFSGDTLFNLSWGRCDFPCSSCDEMKKTLKRLKELPDTLKLMPGHGNTSLLGYEKEKNYAFQEGAVLLPDEKDNYE